MIKNGQYIYKSINVSDINWTNWMNTFTYLLLTYGSSQKSQPVAITCIWKT